MIDVKGQRPAASSRALIEAAQFNLQDLLAQAPAAIGLLNGPEHRWSFVNNEAVRVTGRRSPDEFLGKTIGESLPELKQEGVAEALEQVFQTGEPFKGTETKVVLRRGTNGESEEAYFDYVFQPVRDSAGHVEGILIHAVDVTDKVIARKELEESAQRFRLAQSAAQIGSWEWDPVTGISSLSAELHRMFATDPVDPEHVQKWMARVHPDDWAMVQQKMELGNATGSMDFEYRYLHPESGTRWLYCKGSRLPGRPAMLGIVQDVTARKMADAALRATEDRFRTIVEATPECVKLVARDGTLLHMNSAGLRMVGAGRLEDVVGDSVYDLIALEDRERFQRFNEDICEGARGSLEFDIVGITGVRRHMDTHAVPVRSADGTLVQLAVTRDVTDTKLAQVDSQRLSAIVSSSDDAIVSKDLNGIVTSWNRAAEQMFGFTAAEMIGQAILKIIPPELHEDETRILQTIARGEKIDHFETVRMRKDGERIDVSLTVSPLRNQAGVIVGAAKIARDITQRRKSERALHTAERLASVGRLAATVAHEINNPLEALTNLIYLARHAKTQEASEKFLAGAEEELDRISHLTKQTLGFYRETKGASTVRVGSLVTSLLWVFSSRLRNRRISILPEINVDPEISAVPGELRQLVANLISNSIDAAHEGGMISIRVERAKDWTAKRREGVRLTVGDDGSGIPPETRAKLFEPFFTTKKDVGTGLGLWVCKSIVEKHDGTIRVKSSSKPGKSWTVFSIFLPLNPHPAEQTEMVRQAV